MVNGEGVVYDGCSGESEVVEGSGRGCGVERTEPGRGAGAGEPARKEGHRAVMG